MRSVLIKRTAEITLSAEAWELFTEPGCDAAARALNQAAEKAIAESGSYAQAHAKLLEALDQWRHFGATDTEPRYVAHCILMEAFPEARDNF